MSTRILWTISLPSAAVGWVGLLFITGALPPWSTVALVLAPALLALAVTFSAAPLVWVLAHRAEIAAIGQRPAVALRVAAWIGLWAAVALALRLTGYFDWVVLLTLAVVLMLIEAFLQQLARPRGPWTRRRRTDDDGQPVKIGRPKA